MAEQTDILLVALTFAVLVLAGAVFVVGARIRVGTGPLRAVARSPGLSWATRVRSLFQGSATAPPTRVVWGSDHAPLLVIEELPGLPARTTPVPLTVTTRRQLGGVLEALPTLGLAGANAAERTVRIVLSPELQARMADGTAQLMQSNAVPGGLRTVVQDCATGQIIGHGSVVSQLNPVAVVTAAWQVAALLTAQKHLADISAHLSTIEQGVQRIEGWLREELLAKIHADFYHLRQILDAAKRGGLTDCDRAAYASTLEQVERQNTAAMRHIEAALTRLVRDVENTKVSAWARRDLDKNVGSLDETAGKYEELFDGYLVAALVRIVAARLRLVLGMNEHHAKSIAEKIGSEIKTFRESDPQRMRKALLECGAQLGATFAPGKAVDEARYKLLRSVPDRLQARKADAEAYAAACGLQSDAREDVPARTGPLDLIVTLNAEGQPTALARAVGATPN